MSYVTGKHMSRRTVLKGMGVTLALPFLDAMVPASTAYARTAAARAASRTRLVAIEMVHGSAGTTSLGSQMNLWSPAAVGSAFDLAPTSLLPFDRFREYLTIVSNTDVRNAEAFLPAEIGGDHFRSSAVFLTQAHPKQTQGSDVHVGVSLDQLYAERFGQDTAIPSMQLCIENVDQAGGCAYGYSCVYTDTISWSSPTQPMPMIRDPRAAFDQLFGVGATPEERLADRRADHSLLDWVTGEVAQLKRELGPRDRARLDAYLDGIREIERRIQRVESRNTSGEPRQMPEAPVGVPDSFAEHVHLMMDLMALAFAADITRVFSFKLSRDSSSRAFPESGVTTGFHPASHHQEKEARLLDFAKINTYHVSMVPYFLERLKATADGDSNLLERSLILYGSPMGDSNLHNHKRCPLLVAGHANGRLKGNLHVKAPDGTPMANVMLAVLHELGLDDLDRFGDSTGAFPLASASRQTDVAAKILRHPSMQKPVSAVFRAVAVGVMCLPLVLHASAAGLADAVRQGDHDAVRRLLEHGADVNAAPADGTTPLHWAALTGDVEAAGMLLQAGANVRATTRLGGYTPLLLAARNGNAGVVAELLASGADPNQPTTTGTSPLMFAAASGKVAAVKALLDHGANVNAKDASRGENALAFAAASGRADAIRLLAAHGADIRATSLVVDLSPFTREQQAIFGGGGGRGREQVGGVDRRFTYNELVGTQGGLTPVIIAARQGQRESVRALLDAGADVNQPSAGDATTPLLIATINGHFDLARFLLDAGADPNRASSNGVTPLYAVLNCQWAQKALYPQPRAYQQQQITYLDLMTALLDKGANPNARVNRKVWYSGYNSDFSAVDETGATPFWRAAYASDVEAMKLLVARGADPNIPTTRTPGHARNGGGLSNEVKDVSALPPVPVGGPGIPPLLAAAGEGYGEGFAGNAHTVAPFGMLAAVKYLVDDLHVDVNATDADGNTAVHNAAARGDNAMILFLVSRGASVLGINREGQTTVDMANGPVQRVQPFPETIALLEKLGAKNHHKCVSC